TVEAARGGCSEALPPTHLESGVERTAPQRRPPARWFAAPSAPGAEHRLRETPDVARIVILAGPPSCAPHSWRSPGEVGGAHQLQQLGADLGDVPGSEREDQIARLQTRQNRASQLGTPFNPRDVSVPTRDDRLLQGSRINSRNRLLSRGIDPGEKGGIGCVGSAC